MKKIYINGELPKSCAECEFVIEENFGDLTCGCSGFCFGYISHCKLPKTRIEDCPLKRASELTEPLERRIKVLESAVYIAGQYLDHAKNYDNKLSVFWKGISREILIQQAEKELEDNQCNN